MDVVGLILKRFDTRGLRAQESEFAGQVTTATIALVALIATNSCQPLDHDDYQIRFNPLAEQHVRLFAEHKAIADEITDRQTRRKAYERCQQ